MKIALHILGINLAKFTAYLSQAFNLGSGTSLPGMLAQKVSPDLFSYLVSQTKKDIIFVTGTNGKTTTSGLLAGILKADNRKIAHNRKGANMLTGLITALSQESSIFGNLNVDNCLLEIDEAYLPVITAKADPNIVVLTNLFRDQLDRYGELDTTAKKVYAGIEKIKNKKDLCIIVNADDPITSGVAEKTNVKKLYFGIDNIVFSNNQDISESQKEITTCKCGKNYMYSKIVYSHLGHYHCECGNKRPEPDIIATQVEIGIESSTITVKSNEHEFSYKLHLPGLYNVYNSLCAISTALTLGIAPKTIVNGIENYSTVFGRAETLKINNKDVLIQLIKNPVGATEVLKTVNNDPNSKLIIAINDNYADGRDVSWLWDAGFELLKNYQKEIICSGHRAYDMAVRLKYAGVNTKLISVEEDIKTAIEKHVRSLSENEKLYILPTYTVLLDMQLFLPKMINK
ncbi:MAG: Mur ligase family protein [Cyanobacteriota bacterium]